MTRLSRLSRLSRLARSPSLPALHGVSVASASIAMGLAGLGASACGRVNGVEPSTLTVAAASDLSAAFQEIGAAYARETGRTPVFTFGSTGLLGKQLREGAPFDVFAAASVQYADAAIAAGDCEASTKVLYARGRIVLWARRGVRAPGGVPELIEPRFARIAIANPEHAPYGRAAREALERGGVWEAVKSRIVFGENVQQTLKFAQSGNADVAVVALSLAIVTKDGEYVLLDEGSHNPIDQALVACRGGKNFAAGRDFAAFVSSPAGRAIMKRYGFVLPGEIFAAGARQPP